MATSTELQLRGLILSSSDLRQLTSEGGNPWPDALIEDYLNILNNLITLSQSIDEKNDIIKSTTVVVATPYTPTDTDEEIFVDTTAQPITITLPKGQDGRNYRIINIGASNNDVTLTPCGS
jgi:hypothetical protein